MRNLLDYHHHHQQTVTLHIRVLKTTPLPLFLHHLHLPLHLRIKTWPNLTKGRWHMWREENVNLDLWLAVQYPAVKTVSLLDDLLFQCVYEGLCRDVKFGMFLKMRS